MSVRKSGKIIAGTPRTTGGVEIGDMGFAPLGIDESLNLRRYLNGQLISQTQFVSFTTKVKSAVALFPSLATTESNWQSEKALSKLGQVGKFVIDDTAQTIRLPAVVNAQGLLGLSGIGNLVNESLPNITGKAGKTSSASVSGAFYKGVSAGNADQVTNTGNVVELDASRSSSTYQNNAPVQQEAVQYPYYIQVATGVEETLPAIREYNINTPFFFGQSMYSDVAPDNASWLASNGQYNARAVYPDYYDWLVEKRNSNTKTFYLWKNLGDETGLFLTETNTLSVGSVLYGYSPVIKFGEILEISGNDVALRNDVANTADAMSVDLSNPTYAGNIPVYDSSKMNIISKEDLDNWNIPTNTSDYDFVVNQNDQTFRLPLLNGEEMLPNGTRRLISNNFAAGNTYYTAERNVFVTVNVQNTAHRRLWDNYIDREAWAQQSAQTEYGAVTLFIPKGHQYGVYWQGGTGTGEPRSIYEVDAVGNGTLYYYVGDTVQDASLINAGAVLGQLSNKADIDASNFNADGKSLLSGLGMPSGRYIDLTLGASGSTYTAPANGWVFFQDTANLPGSTLVLGTAYIRVSQTPGADGNPIMSAIMPVKNGDIFYTDYSGVTGGNRSFRFIYAEGEN